MTSALTQKDAYKIGHINQYPEGTELVYSNFTPRSSRLSPVPSDLNDDKIVFFGLQYYIKDYLIKEWNETFFDKPKEEVVAKYARRVNAMLGEGAIDFKHIEALHDLGYLPIEIKALPEGVKVPMKVPMLTIKNTLPEFYWLTNTLETSLSNELWKPCTTATIAKAYHTLLKEYAIKTGSPLDFVGIQGHDFSARGMSGRKDAAICGMGHLLSFIGTDSVGAIDAAEDFYNADCEKELLGVSVNASEHSVMCMGSQEGEFETYKRFLTELYPSGVVSIVSDTWDYWEVLTDFMPRLKDVIMNRQKDALGLAKCVLRPDSGNPVDIICGTGSKAISLADSPLDFEQWKGWVAEHINETFCEDLAEDCTNPVFDMSQSYNHNGDIYKVTYTPELNRHDKTYYYVDNWGDDVSYCEFEELEPTPEQKGSVEVLWDLFGGTINDKGYKVLDEHIGLIYGDSITLERAKLILEKLEAKGFASSNIVFGYGSFTYQYITRDSYGMAMKATAGIVDGKLIEICKDPKTDDGTKKSAKGLLRVEKENGEYVLYDQQDEFWETQGKLQTVFKDGELRVDLDFQEVRDNLK